MVDSGVHPSLHTNCHHQVTYCNINLMIVYPSPYERLVWDYKRANESLINAALNKVDWEFLFSNKSVNQQVIIFNQSVMNIFSNFVLNKFVTFNDRDPPWMTSNIKDKINYRNIYRKYMKKGKQQIDYMILQNTTKELSELISSIKNDYNLHLANKLIDSTTSSKTNWSILKTSCNGRKIPIIPPLLINDKLETDFKKKTHHFNAFFASKCTPLINNCALPDSVDHISTAKLEELLFNSIFKFLDDNNLSFNQSGFRQSDSCEY